MRYTEALDAHIDQQYAEYLSWEHFPDEEILTRDGFIDPDYSGDVFIMIREVATLVAQKMGELVTFEVFDNCREHGLTVSSPFGWTFCWYRHRNSDRLHIEGCETTQVQPWGPYGGVDKFDTLWATEHENYQSVADALVAMLELVAEKRDGKPYDITRRQLTIAGQTAVFA